MIKIATIIGARPQIIKAAAISRILKEKYPDTVREIIVHTGQHYDENMSAVFFKQLNIPSPDYNLEVGSGLHGKQTARMIEGIEEVLLTEKPDFVLIYGDTNSTLAAATAASKIHIPVAHVEAGLRSFNKSMPEEINRIVADHLSTLLFTPTHTGLRNLLHEGFDITREQPFTPDNPGIFHCGDVMYDNMLFFKKRARAESGILSQLGIKTNGFVLATIHRDHNTDNPERLVSLFSAILHIADTAKIPVVLPLHPRTMKLLPENLDKNLYENLVTNSRIHLIPPCSFLDMIVLESDCKLVITDSGGVQKEAFFNQKPCIILRPETEWKEIVDNQCGILADADYNRIIEAFHHFDSNPVTTFPVLYGDGHAAEFICQKIIDSV